MLACLYGDSLWKAIFKSGRVLQIAFKMDTLFRRSVFAPAALSHSRQCFMRIYINNITYKVTCYSMCFVHLNVNDGLSDF